MPSAHRQPPQPVSTDDHGMENFIAPTINIHGYQWEHKGHVLMVEEMSRSDLQQALCATMDILEHMETQQENLRQLMDAWRKGRPVPEHLRDKSEG